MAGSVIQGWFPRGVTQLRMDSRVAQQQTHPQATRLPLHLATFPVHGGQPLPMGVRQRMESAFGQTFADVRIHVGPHVQRIGAGAFTQGTHVHFAPGQYAPETADGQRLLAHELAHVVQQRTGRARNPFSEGTAVLHDRVLEAEAERMAQRVGVAQRAAAAAPRTLQRRPAGVAQPLWSDGFSFNWLRSVAKHRRATNYGIDAYIYSNEASLVPTVLAGINTALQAVPAAWRTALISRKQLGYIQVTVERGKGMVGGQREGSKYIEVYYDPAEVGLTRSAHASTTHNTHAMAGYNLFQAVIIHEIGHLIDDLLQMSNGDVANRPARFKRYLSLATATADLATKNPTLGGIPVANPSALTRAQIPTHRDTLNNVTRLVYTETHVQRVLYKTVEGGSYPYTSCDLAAMTARAPISFYEWANVGDHIAENFAHMVLSGGHPQNGTQQAISDALTNLLTPPVVVVVA
jgi:predicted SprT family Zn-dependent metalloprotease